MPDHLELPWNTEGERAGQSATAEQACVTTAEKHRQGRESVWEGNSADFIRTRRQYLNLSNSVLGDSLLQKIHPDGLVIQWLLKYPFVCVRVGDPRRYHPGTREYYFLRPKQSLTGSVGADSLGSSRLLLKTINWGKKPLKEVSNFPDTGQS